MYEKMLRPEYTINVLHVALLGVTGAQMPGVMEYLMQRNLDGVEKRTNNKRVPTVAFKFM